MRHTLERCYIIIFLATIFMILRNAKTSTAIN